jgi:hypothetical protein
LGKIKDSAIIKLHLQQASIGEGNGVRMPYDGSKNILF